MSEILEEFVSGFCRTCNGTRTVCCEYERGADGRLRLTDFECDPERCANSAACEIWREAGRRAEG
ncbi:MAG: hypothetical protein Q4C82_05070 [Eubacteriales bacterium]|nr:hypothetical protein [Eubacteriales bacterium]